MPKLNIQRFRQLRNDKSWTLADVARIAGVGFGTPSRWEHGLAKPHRRMMKRLAKIFNVSIEELIDVSEMDENNK